MSISCPAAGCGSASASAGATSSTRRSDRTSPPAAPGRKNRSSCSAACSPSPSSTSPAASTASTAPPSCPSRRARSRSGSAAPPSGLRARRPPRRRLHLHRRRHRPGHRELEPATRARRDLGRSVEAFGGEYVALPHEGDLKTTADAWRQAGGTHLSAVTMGLGLDSIDSHIAHLTSIAHTVTH